MYRIRAVDGADPDVAKTLRRFNAKIDVWPKLTKDELEGRGCFWWLVYRDDKCVGFTGIVPSHYYANCGYLKRTYIAKSARGHSLQLRCFRVREAKARKIGWDMIVSECTNTVFSANNFIRAGYQLFDPADCPIAKKRWAFQDSLYWKKLL